jgi:hypothetical protein
MVTHLQYIRARVLRALTRLARLIAALILGPATVLKTPSGHRFIFDRRRGRLLPVIAGGADDDDAADKDDDEDKSDDAADKDDDEDKSDDAADKDDDDLDRTPDWKRESRKHERDKKKALKERDELRQKLKEREDADKDETQKAIDAAREEGRTAALTEAEKDRRADRLEMASLRLATSGVLVGDGDDAKKHKFADPEDAEAHLQRAIKRGDVDEDDLFDDNNRIKKDALTEALAEILESKPHLRAAAGGGKGDEDKNTAEGGADAGKGDKGSAKDLEEMSPDDHLKELQKR